MADADPDTLITHDARRADPSYAFALSRLDTSDFRHTPVGVFRERGAAKLRQLMAEQIATARRQSGRGRPGRPAGRRSDTWESRLTRFTRCASPRSRTTPGRRPGRARRAAVMSSERAPSTQCSTSARGLLHGLVTAQQRQRLIQQGLIGQVGLGQQPAQPGVRPATAPPNASAYSTGRVRTPWRRSVPGVLPDWAGSLAMSITSSDSCQATPSCSQATAIRSASGRGHRRTGRRTGRRWRSASRSSPLSPACRRPAGPDRDAGRRSRPSGR